MDAIKLLEMAPVIRRTASFPSSAAPTPSPPRGPLAPNSRYAPPGVVDLTRASPSSVSGVPINVAPQPRFPQSSPASIPPQPLRRQPPLLVSPQPAPRLPAPQPGSASVSWRIEHATWSEQASVTFLPPGSNTCWVPIVFDLETTGECNFTFPIFFNFFFESLPTPILLSYSLLKFSSKLNHPYILLLYFY